MDEAILHALKALSLLEIAGHMVIVLVHAIQIISATSVKEFAQHIVASEFPHRGPEELSWF